MPTAPSSTEPPRRTPVRAASRPRAAPSRTSPSSSASAAGRTTPPPGPGLRWSSSSHPGDRDRTRVRARRRRRRPGVRHLPADALGDGRHPGPQRRLGDRLRRRPRADLARPGVAVPDQPHHRPPRRAGAGAPQHRVDDPGLDPARVDGLQLRARTTCSRPSWSSCCGCSSRPRSARWSPGRWRRYAAAPRHRDHRGAPGVPRSRRRAIQLTRHTTAVLDQIPTLWVFQGAVSGWGLRWWVAVAALMVGSMVGGRRSVPYPAHLAARRMPRDEARMETDQHEPRPDAAHGARPPDPRRPGLGLAVGADAARRDGARHRPRPGGGLRQPALAVDDDPPRPGRLRWRPAVRRQRVVPRRPRRAVAGEPPGPADRALRRPGLGADRVPRRRLR